MIYSMVSSKASIREFQFRKFNMLIPYTIVWKPIHFDGLVRYVGFCTFKWTICFLEHTDMMVRGQLISYSQ